MHSKKSYLFIVYFRQYFNRRILGSTSFLLSSESFDDTLLVEKMYLNTFIGRFRLYLLQFYM